MNNIRIIKPGLLTTVQDNGRWGYQQFGVTVAGAMDNFSFRVANLLVGNHENQAVLEITFLGPEIEFDCNEVIAITGADMKPKLNKEPIEMWTTISVKKGDRLSLSNAVIGLRSYIAFSRGIDIPEIMGSRSTYLRGKLGGFKGRKLESGDELPLGERILNSIGSYIPNKYIPIYEKEYTLRVVLGPQDNYFTDEGLDAFLGSVYKITSEADRMGYRLDGPKITHKTTADIISDATVFGSVQVPGEGLPIIMMADRGTTGGYTKIGTVITPDLSILAQMGPGSSLKFEEVSILESHKIYKEYENNISELKKFIEGNRFEFNKSKAFRMIIFGKAYEINVREIKGT